jgi:Calcium binding
VTLGQIPGASIERCQEDGLDWSLMVLPTHEVDLSEPRDTLADVERAKKELSIQWHSSDAQDRRIQEVLAKADPGNDNEAFRSWYDYLSKVLTFPFSAEVVESESRPLQPGDQIKVLGIRGVEDPYGILVDVRTGHRKFVGLLHVFRRNPDEKPTSPRHVRTTSESKARSVLHRDSEHMKRPDPKVWF